MPQLPPYDSKYEEHVKRLLESTTYQGECYIYKVDVVDERPPLQIARSKERAAVWSAIIFHGDERPLIALHTCDVPKCWNPSHVYWGTHQQNKFDHLERGRPQDYSNRRGEGNPNAKLTNAQACEIAVRFASGERAIVLAKEYGVERKAIRRAYIRVKGMPEGQEGPTGSRFEHGWD